MNRLTYLGQCFELLVGKPPFDSENIFQLGEKIRREEPYYPPSLSYSASSFLRGLLNKRPQKRLTASQVTTDCFYLSC